MASTALQTIGLPAVMPGGRAAIDLLAQAEREAAAANAKRNEIKEIRNYKQLDKVDLDFDSPRMKMALHNLGCSKEECIKKYLFLVINIYRERSEFDRKGVDDDVINLRFKHYQNRLIDILNRILEERRRISK